MASRKWVQMNETSDNNHLETDIWHDAEQQKREPVSEYDPELDIFCIYFVPAAGDEKILTHHVDRNVGLLFRQSDRQVIGMRIESYKASFIPKYGQKEWSLVNTGAYLRGIRDVKFAVTGRSAGRKERLFEPPKPIFA